MRFKMPEKLQLYYKLNKIKICNVQTGKKKNLQKSEVLVHLTSNGRVNNI